MRNIFLIIVSLSLIGLICVAAGFVQQVSCLSPQALVSSEDGNLLYVAEGGAKQIAVFNTKSGKVIKTIDVPAEPTGLALSCDGAYLYVTCAAPQGLVCVIATDTRMIVKQIPVGHGSRSPVLSPDGKMLYVCNRFSNNVSVINLKENRHVASVNVSRQPFAADITPDGKWLYVGNHLPDGPANAESVASKLSVINTGTMNVDVCILLPNGSTALRGVAVSPDGRYVYVTHILARYTVPTTQAEQGWINTNALSIIDANNKKLISTVLLDDVDNGAANPWALLCTADGKYICVTHAGTNELSIIDASALMEKIKNYGGDNKRIQAQPPVPALPVQAPQVQAVRQDKPGAYNLSSFTDVSKELSFLYGIRRRVKLCGKGPRALAIAGSRVYVAEYFTDSITLVDINKKPGAETIAMPLGPIPQMTVRRRGEAFFNDASLCFQNWQSCASCHPDARADGLNWDLLNDGIGNPKNTKSLLLSHKTPPAMATGVRDRAEIAVRSGIKHIQFAQRPQEDAVAIDEYLKSLKPVPSPYLVDGRLSRAAKRGRKVFDKAGCDKCHPAPLYTDLKKYDVGTGTGYLERGREYDTPTLVEVWRAAPYLYDGRAATIKEVLTKYNSGDMHGVTSGLTDKQINDLAEFVLSQ